MDIPGLEDIRRREILLLRCIGLILGRGDAEVPAFVFVQKSAEDGWRVEIWPVDLLIICGEK